MKSEFEIAITQLSADRNLAPEVILEAIETALVSAYKRNYGANQNVSVTIDPRTGQARIAVKKTVVEEPRDEDTEITLAEAREHEPDAALGDLIDIEIKPRNFGRIAAQTAKQVITQRIREAERDSVYLEYADRTGEVVNGIIQNIDTRSGNAVLNMGKAEALLPRSEQIPREHYRFNQRLRVYIVSVDRTGHGPQIVVSRTHRDLLRRLFELEVPEIFNGAVEVKAIAREPGARSKVAVTALQTGVDPVGSCVGMRGVRIRNIVNELNGEKIDVVAWSSDMTEFIANALSPAKVLSVHMNEREGTAKVVVPDRALSLAIGKEGQNARLAAKLTGWRIDIKSEAEAAEEAEKLAAEMEEAAKQAQELDEARQAAAELLAQAETALDEEEPSLAEEEAIPSETPEGEVGAEEQAAEGEEEAVVSDEKPEIEGATEEPAEAPQEVPVEEIPTPVAEEPVDETAAEEEATPEPSEEQEPLDEPEEESFDFDFEDEDEEKIAELDKAREREAREKKARGRTLEYDERLGRVVARKRHKSRGSRNWQDEDWDDDLDD